MFLAALGMVGIEEYAIALALLAVALVMFLRHILTWPVVYPRTRLTTLLIKITATVSVIVFLLGFAVIILRVKKEKSWTNLTRGDLSALYAYFTAPSHLWIVVVIAFIAGVGIAIIFVSVRDRKRSYCPNEKIHQTTLNDRHQLGHWIRVFKVETIAHLVEGANLGEPYVDFRIFLVSMALPNVKIVTETRGAIHFFRHRGDPHPLRLEPPPLLDDNEAREIIFRSKCLFTLKQALSRGYADLIMRNTGTGFFRFNELYIMLRTVDDAHVQGLHINEVLETAFDIQVNTEKVFECSFVN